jgi:hypothetical protein
MKRLCFALGALLFLFAARAFAVGSLADITIYDRASGRVLPTYYSEGRWYVAGRPGNEYEVRIRNQSGADLLAVTSVDGVNVITGETAAPSQSGYVLTPWQRLQIKGWRKDMTRVAAFYFTSLDDSYAARTGRPDHVGVIGVALFKRKVEPPVYLEERSRREEQFPRYPQSNEAPARDSASGGAQPAVPAMPSPGPHAQSLPREKSLGTGHGRSENSHARYTTFERASDEPNEVVAIYYDSYANLIARGIIRETPRDPQPFPARFVPDPPAR